MFDIGLGQKMHMLCKGHGKPVGNYFVINCCCLLHLCVCVSVSFTLSLTLF